MKNQIDITQEVINDFIVNEFRKYPMNFFQESDLHCLLYTRLFDRFKLENVIARIPADMLGSEKNYPEGEIITNPVKTEFRNCPDILIINVDKIISYSEEAKLLNKPMNSEVFGRQPIMIAIELKFCTYGSNNAFALKNEMLDDWSKMSRKKNITDDRESKVRWRDITGLCLLFIQEYTEAEKISKHYRDQERDQVLLEKGKVKKYIICPEGFGIFEDASQI